MDPFTKTTMSAMSGMRAQAYRMQVVSENIANVDTHGYRRKLITFDNVFNKDTNANQVQISSLYLDAKAPHEIFDPSHPLANADGFVIGSNVNMMTEFADAREAKRSYEAGLEMFRQSRDLYGSLLDILKR